MLIVESLRELKAQPAHPLVQESYPNLIGNVQAWKPCNAFATLPQSWSGRKNDN